MSIKVQKYLANLGKSVAYSTADVLKTKFDYVDEVKSENQEVFKEVYHSIKDYRTTFARVKKAITNNKVMDAARVGFDSVVYSVTTGDFYAKEKETEVINKYGGSLMQGMDMDDDDFDFEKKEDVSEGDMVIATAVKKNSKISTAITTEAIVKTGKAQIDVAKENTMLLYTQNERLLNKLDGGFENIMGFLKQNGEATAKVQNQMNENLNKFMSNVDNNITKLTAQMDELLQMQRNMYNPQKQEEKKRVGYDDIVSSGGVLNIREYANMVKKNAFNTINDQFGGTLGMIFGDTMGEGSNMLAQFAANPFRALMETGINKMLGKSFDSSAKQLNDTMKNLVPDIIAKFNAAGKKEDSGIWGMLGKIFGIKTGTNESIDTSRYNKGAIPFDGITKKSITDVIPYYLRKMTSALTGDQEMVYDFNTGRWNTMTSVLQSYHKTVNQARDSTASLIKGVLEGGTGRSLNSMFSDKRAYDEAERTIESLAAKFQNAGDFGAIRDTDLTSAEAVIYQAMKDIYARDMNIDSRQNSGRAGRYVFDSKGKRVRIQTQSVSGFNKGLLDARKSQNSSIKSMNEQGTLATTIVAEGMQGLDPTKYRGKSYTDSIGDMNQRAIQEMPTAQILLRAKDEYGVTLYGYLRNMGSSLNYIKAYSTYLENLPFINSNTNGDGGAPGRIDREMIKQELARSSINYIENKTEDAYAGRYYSHMEEKAKRKAHEEYGKKALVAQAKAAEKGKSYDLVTNMTDYKSEGEQVGLARLISQYEVSSEAEALEQIRKDEAKQKKERWKSIEDIFGKEATDKLKKADENFDPDKGLTENLKKAQTMSEKILIMGKYFTAKSNGTLGDRMADQLLKVDNWLQKLIYGEDIKADDEKKSLFDRLKSAVDEGFKKIRDTVQNGFEKLKTDVYDKYLKEHVDKIKNAIFGETDSEGNVTQQGLLSPFISGFRKGMARNKDDVVKMWQDEKRRAKELANKITGNEDDSDSSSSSSSSSSSLSTTSPVPTPPTYAQKIAAKRQSIENRLYSFDYEDPDDLEKIVRRISTYEDYNKTQSEEQSKIAGPSFSTDREREIRKQNMISELQTKIQNQEAAIPVYERKISELNTKLMSGNLINPDEISSVQAQLRDQEAKLAKTKENLEKNKKQLERITGSKTRIKFMAAGGVNKTGKSFLSATSPNEIRIGADGSTEVFPSYGIRSINPGDTIINPADASTRQKQARNERSMINNIRSNAEANDKLEPVSEQQEQGEIEQYDLKKLTNWETLSSKDQQAAFLGNLASRGALGAGVGLLVGGPLLGAAIGAASSLTKSTDGFSNFLFGNAIRDKDGNVQVDDNGNAKRADNGLISQELMNAVPDIKRFGLGGLVAGLVTPLGPLGGVLAGSALGFAKNSEMFQGTLFGEGSMFSKENMDKLKKGAKNIGVGAAAGALFIPGPFGLIGSALLGATAGYVTSTDKFKNAILGELEDPNDPNSKRHGGMVGALKSGIEPLKDIGKTLVTDIFDEIFGKKNGDGKREGGLFGIVRDTVISPLAEGTKSISKELRNKVTDIGFWAQKTWMDIRKLYAGGNWARLFGERGVNFVNGATKLAGNAAKIALKPASLVANAYKGFGDSLTAKRIRRGRADDMTARERLDFRGKHGMAANDDFSDFDNLLSAMNNDEMQLLLDRLNVTVNANEATDKEYISLAQGLTSKFEDILSQSEIDKLNTLIKNKEYGNAERMIKTHMFKGKNNNGVTQEQRDVMMGILNRYKKDRAGVDDRIDKAKQAGELASDELKALGLNIDLSDAQQVDSVEKMLRREMLHNEAGLTDEDLAYDREREFWTDSKSPLEPVKSGINSIVETIDNIYAEIRISNEYKELTPEEKAKYGSMEEYIEYRKQGKIQEEEAKKAREATKVSTKLRPMDNTLIHTSDDALELGPDNMKERVKEVVDRATMVFVNLVMKQINNKELIDQDFMEWKIENGKEDDEIEMNNICLTRKDGVRIERHDKVYELSMVMYDVKKAGNNVEVTLSGSQPGDFTVQLDEFVTDYTKAYLKDISKNDTKSYMSLIDMAKKSIKIASLVTVASIIPGGALALGAIFGASKLNKKFDVTGRIKKKFRAFKHAAKHALGEHELDVDKAKLESYATKEYVRALSTNDPRLDEIAQEKFNKDFNELTDEEAEQVRNAFKEKVKEDKMFHTIRGRGLKGGIKQIGRIAKSGVKNAVEGAIDKVKAKKKEQQEKETMLGKFFDKLDKWHDKHEKQKLDGKKDSKLAKIIKWLFIGGIAVPILVGFIKDKIVPAVHDKIAPWLSKAKDKLIGVKNERTGEYEGGLVSGIVNPIRKFFGDKLQKVHDWFHNTGDFTGENSGFKGMINNLKGVGMYIVDLWKSGASTIINTMIPVLVKNMVVNAVPVLKSVGKGLIEGIFEIIHNKDKNNGVQAVDSVNPEIMQGDTSAPSSFGKTTRYGFNNTVGGSIAVTSPTIASLNTSTYVYSSDGVKASTTKNPDGTITAEDNQGRSVTTEKLNANEMIASGVNNNGQAIFYKRSDTNHTNPYYYRESDGQYVPATDLNNVYNEKIKDTEAWKNHVDFVNNGGQYEDDYNVSGNTSIGSRTAKVAVKGIFDKNVARNLANSSRTFNKVGNFLSKAGNITSKIPVLGGLIGRSSKVLGVASKGAGKVTDVLGGTSGILNGGIRASLDAADKAAGRGHFSAEYMALSRSASTEKANQLFQDVYEKAIQSGMTEKEATKLAKKRTKNFVKYADDALEKGLGIDDIARKADDFADDIVKSGAKPKVAAKRSSKLGTKFKTFAGKVVEKTGANKIIDKAVDGAKTIGTNIKTSVGKYITGIFDSISAKFGEFLTNHPKISEMILTPLKNFCEKFTKKGANQTAKKGIKEAAEEMLKTIGKKCAQRAAKEGTSKTGRAVFNQIASVCNTVPLADIVSVAVTIVFAIGDLFTGFNNAGNILHVPNNQLTVAERFAAALIRMVPNLLCAMPEPVGLICTPLFILISETTIADFFIDGVGGFCEAAFGANPFKDTQRKREEAQAVVDEYNAEHNTNLSFEQWNNRENATWYTKAINGLGAGVGKLTGKSKQVESDLEAAGYKVSAKNETVTNIKDMLIEIMARVWGHYGKGYKKNFGISQDRFTEASTKMIDKIVILLNKKSDEELDNILASVDKYNNVANFKVNGKKSYNKGYKNAISYLGLGKSTKQTTLLKVLAGLTHLVCDALGGDDSHEFRAIVVSVYGDYFRDAEDEYMKEMVDENNKYISGVNSEYSDYGGFDNSVFNSKTQQEEPDTEDIASNANANDKLSPINVNGKSNHLISGLEKGFAWIKENNPLEKVGLFFANLINDSIRGLTGGFEGIQDFFKNLIGKNRSTNESIDSLSLLPSDKKYWKIETDKKQPFMSGLFNFVESMNRMVKAPFALAAASLAGGLDAVTSSSGTTGGTSSSGTTSNGGTTSSGGTSSGSTSSGGALSKIWNGAKNVASKLWSGVKSLFGKGKNDNDSETGYGDDPYHIYQRDYSGAYRTSGDSEAQTIADSGCGPASAASVLRMYGKKGDMHNAVNYALQNKYKEVDGGTYPQYFNDYLNKNGISTNSNADNADVVNSLAQGKPVVLMGRDSANKGNTPYGSKYSHYVVARGLDSKGNVIVEDSEDKKGSTRYSLAETLKNSTVRITTGGKGRYGRAKDDESVGSKYITGVAGLTTTAVSNIVASAANAVMGIKPGSSSSSSGSNAGTAASNLTGDAAAALGKELTMSDGKGNTHTIKITEDEVELYNMLTTECGLSPAAACGAIGNWEQECGINRIKETAIKGVIAYGGGIMQWTPGSKHTNWAASHGFSSDPWSWEANLAHAKEEITTGGNWSNPKKANPSFESEGLTPVSSFAEFKALTDPESAAANFERVYEVSGDWNGKNSEGVHYKENMIHDNLRRLNAKILYQLIVGGGSGRGKGGLFTTITKKFMDNTSKAVAFSAINKVMQLTSNVGAISLTTANQEQSSGATAGSTDYQGTKYELTDSEIAQLAYVCKREQGGSEWGTKFEASLMCNLFEYHNRNSQKWKSVWDYVMHSGWFASRSTGSSTDDQQLIGWVKDVICNGNRVCPQCIIEHDCMSDFSRIYNGERSNKAGFKANVTEFDNVYGGHWIFWSFPGGDTSMDPFGYTKASLEWAGGQVPAAPSWGNNSEDTSGSGRGKDDEVTIDRKASDNIMDGAVGIERVKSYSNADKSRAPASSNRATRRAIKFNRPVHSINIAGRGGSFYGRGIWGRDGDPQGEEPANSEDVSTDETTEATTDETTDATATTDTNSNSNQGIATGLIGLLGKYSKAVTRGIFGNFYDALYGSEPDGDGSTVGSNGSNGASASYNGTDVVYAAAMVFEALYKADPSLKYDLTGSTTHTLTCRDGTVIEHARPDCSGMMSAVLHYMGYYTYKTKEYSATYHGEGLNATGLKDLSNIMDANGNPTTDWEVLSGSEATGDNAKPGDIRIIVGQHTDMFVFYGSGNYPRGFNAGSGDCGDSIGDGMYNSYCLATYYFEHNNQLPDPSSVTGGRGQPGAGTITDSSCGYVLRFKGKSASGRGKGKTDLAKLNNKVRKSNFVYTDGGKIPVSSINAKKHTKFGRGIWGRDGDELQGEEPNTTPNTNEQTADEAAAIAENESQSAAADALAESNANTASSERPATTLISKLSKYAKAAVKGVFGNFYDALYGSEVEEESSNNAADATAGAPVGSGTAGTLQNAIPYSEYGIWKQSWNGRWEHHICDGWNKKTAISIGGGTIGEAGCSLTSTALMLVHSGVVQESTFNPGVFADDINSRSNCRGGCGTDAPMRHMCEYKGNTTMQYVDRTDRFEGGSFDELYNYCLESMQQGYFLIGHVTNHYCCIDYIDTAHKVIFIMDPGFTGYNCWYDGNNKPSVLDSSDKGYTMSSGPSSKRIRGVVRYKSSSSSAASYVLNGRRSFDSAHENGGAPGATISDSGTTAQTTGTTEATANGKYGRAKAKNGTATASNVPNIKKQGIESPYGFERDYDGSGAKRAVTGRGHATGSSSSISLKPYDSISSNRVTPQSQTKSSNNSQIYLTEEAMAGTTPTYHSSNRTNNGLDLNELIKLISTIADNSEKMDSVLTILGAIATNTEQSGNSSSTKPKNITGSKNGLSALRTALDSNNSGEDIINAIYQIAKS